MSATYPGTDYRPGQHIRATVSDPEYFQIGQRVQIISIIEDPCTPDGYAYYSSSFSCLVF
jgi:hypothetical protein